ncbi:hypothetical protein TSAR_010077 [Trichomalopsis sarcophagae]|uniref:Kazal-like domain-containing protein n=1 Tax=Trichomalopsis sarcophagae TaxID=543379 RepID=A0A232F8W9_9HYME|nr:hypothetical protein TSAR_010077 [Trichomalopsis sarcophagae]
MMKLTVFLFATALFCAIANVNAQLESDDYEEEDECPCMTPFNWLPKCGSDGQTYPNEEAIKCQNECNDDRVTIAHDGVCEGDVHFGLV